MAQAPSVQVSRLVILQEPRPARGVGRVTDWERCEDRDSDGIGDVIAPEQAPVPAADRKRREDSEQSAKYRSDQGVNDPEQYRLPGGARRLVEYMRRHRAERAVPGSDVRDVAGGDGVSPRLCLAGARALGTYRKDIGRRALYPNSAAQRLK